ncbi:MAG: copper resistance protein NlpE [Microscillaceae bacterium]|jgi:hypothetical protein|nr:copper resistance protein NlpE [Microscillaceae bacterium]
MMPIVLFFAFLIFANTTSWAQDKLATREWLTSQTWVIKQHRMTGLGFHNSLPKGTQLYFSKDGTWQSSEVIEDLAEGGTWQIDQKGDIILKFINTSETRSFKVLTINQKSLQLSLKKTWATYTFEWIAKD